MTGQGVGAVMRRAATGLLVGIAALFVVNVLFLIGAVAVSSVATRWLGTWLPDAATTGWYRDAWHEFQLGSVLVVTAEVVLGSRGLLYRGPAGGGKG